MDDLLAQQTASLIQKKTETSPNAKDTADEQHHQSAASSSMKTTTNTTEQRVNQSQENGADPEPQLKMVNDPAVSEIQRRNDWARTKNILRIDKIPQDIRVHEFVYFVSGRNAETYPCVVMKVPSQATNGEIESEKQENNSKETNDDGEQLGQGHENAKKKKIRNKRFDVKI